jgi:hypothetical protein
MQSYHGVPCQPRPTIFLFILLYDLRNHKSGFVLLFCFEPKEKFANIAFSHPPVFYATFVDSNHPIFSGRHTQFCGAGATAPSIACPPGSSCVGFATTACPAGSLCPGGYSPPIACPPGAFCPSTGLSVATLCDAGAYCNASGLTAPSSACPPGRVCPRGSVFAAPCPAGQVLWVWV